MDLCAMHRCLNERQYSQWCTGLSVEPGLGKRQMKFSVIRENHSYSYGCFIAYCIYWWGWKARYKVNPSINQSIKQAPQVNVPSFYMTIREVQESSTVCRHLGRNHEDLTFFLRSASWHERNVQVMVAMATGTTGGTWRTGSTTLCQWDLQSLKTLRERTNSGECRFLRQVIWMYEDSCCGPLKAFVKGMCIPSMWKWRDTQPPSHRQQNGTECIVEDYKE